jgi:hypothetical protein
LLNHNIKEKTKKGFSQSIREGMLSNLKTDNMTKDLKVEKGSRKGAKAQRKGIDILGKVFRPQS